MTPADVLYSADYLESIGLRAASERRALGAELSGHTSAWRDGGRPGYQGFLHLVQQQAERIRTDIDEVSGKLRDAAHAYVANEQRSAESLRWSPTDS